MRARGSRMEALARAVMAGTLAPEDFYFAFGDLLNEAHSTAANYGRRRAGSTVDAITDEDRRFGRGRADYETEFLERFLNDLEADRYADDAEAATRRAGQYAGALRGTGNASFVANSADDDGFDWDLGGTEDHCEECPYLAANSPYRKDELPIAPGSNGTPCLFRCDCNLRRRSDGVSGFAAINNSAFSA